MYGVIDVGNCLFCRNVYTNVIFLQNGRICCERPIMYLRQIPENAWNCGNNNYIYANRVNMQNNYIDYWSRNVAAHNKEQCREELRRAFKNMLDAASKQTENTAPMLSIFFDAVGFVMADNFAEAINKSMEIERKYQGIVW